MPLDTSKLFKSIDDFQIYIIGKCYHPDVVVAVQEQPWTESASLQLQPEEDHAQAREERSNQMPAHDQRCFAVEASQTIEEDIDRFYLDRRRPCRVLARTRSSDTRSYGNDVGKFGV